MTSSQTSSFSFSSDYAQIMEQRREYLRVRTIAKLCCECYLAEVAGKTDETAKKGEVA